MAQREIHISTDDAIPNAVDIYSSYTYNITFSMMPQSFWHSGVLPLGTSNEKIIIAQTGVTTKFNIDNLTINTVNDNYGSTATSALTYTTKATFEITEPLGSSLISLMTRAYKQLQEMDLKNGNSSAELYKKGAGPLDLLYLLEVELIGYRGESFDSESKGFTMFEAETDVSPAGAGEVFGKYAWPTYLTQFDFKPDSEGTKYSFEVVSIDQYVKTLSDDTRNIKKDLELKGENITDILTKLGAEITKQIVAGVAGLVPGETDTKKCHEVKIKMGQMHDGTTNGTPSTEWHESANVIPDRYIKILPEPEAQADAVKKTGDEAKKKREFTYNVKKGTSVSDAIRDIMSHSATFPGLITDQILDPADPNKVIKRKDPEKEPTYSYKIHSTLLASDKTTYTGGPQYTITYNIDLKQQGGAQTGDEKNKTKKQQKDIIDSWYIVKKYDYMFTGLNDQVQDIDITFSNAQIFLFPEYGGLGPTYLDNPSTSQNSSDVEAGQRLEAAVLANSRDAELYLEYFQKLQMDLQGALSQIATDGKDFLEGLQSQMKGPAGALIKANGRLPSSPSAVFRKLKVIESTTQFFDKTFEDLTDLQESLEDSANDWAGGLNLKGRVAEIVKKAASPFDFVTTTISGGLSTISNGIDGFVNSINDATGLSLSPDDIPGLGDAQGIIDTLDGAISGSPGPNDGFNPGVLGGGTWNTLVTTAVAENTFTYLEELDFSFLEGVDDVASVRRVKAVPYCTPDSEAGSTAAQHYFSTMLSSSGTGVPYLNRLRMSIKGDPYWLGRKNYVKDIASGKQITVLEDDGGQPRWKPEFSTDRSDTSTAAYDAGSIYLGFRYFFPKEYEIYQEDPSQHTGKIEYSKMDMAYSGYYLVTRTTHQFAGGKFLQDIEAVKTNTYPNIVVEADGTIINTDPSDGDDNETKDGEKSSIGPKGEIDLEGYGLMLNDRVNIDVTLTYDQPTDAGTYDQTTDAGRLGIQDGLNTGNGGG